MSDYDALLRPFARIRRKTHRGLSSPTGSMITPIHSLPRRRCGCVRRSSANIAMSQREKFDPLRLRWELIEKPQRRQSRGCGRCQPLHVSWNSANLSSSDVEFFWCISSTPSQFLANADSLLSNVPAPTLSYWGRDDATDKLFTSPLFARVIGLRIRSTNLR